MVHVCNSRAWEAETEGWCEFKASLGFLFKGNRVDCPQSVRWLDPTGTCALIKKKKMGSFYHGAWFTMSKKKPCFLVNSVASDIVKMTRTMWSHCYLSRTISHKPKWWCTQNCLVPLNLQDCHTPLHVRLSKPDLRSGLFSFILAVLFLFLTHCFASLLASF